MPAPCRHTPSKWHRIKQIVWKLQEDPTPLESSPQHGGYQQQQRQPTTGAAPPASRALCASVLGRQRGGSGAFAAARPAPAATLSLEALSFPGEALALAPPSSGSGS